MPLSHRHSGDPSGFSSYVRPLVRWSNHREARSNEYDNETSLLVRGFSVPTCPSDSDSFGAIAGTSRKRSGHQRRSLATVTTSGERGRHGRGIATDPARRPRHVCWGDAGDRLHLREGPGPRLLPGPHRAHPRPPGRGGALLAGPARGRRRDEPARGAGQPQAPARRRPAGHPADRRRQPGRLWVDAVDFGALTAPTHADPLLLQRADRLYHGDLLDGFVVRNAPAFEEWVLGQRELLRQRALRMLRLLAAHHAAQADQDAAAWYLQRLLGIEPWLEEAHRALMAALAATGRHAAALRQYETCRQLLAEELGVAPAPRTTRLYEDIRRVAGREPQQTRKTSITATWRGPAQPAERPSTLQYSAMR